MITSQELAWMAGILEGEGCFALHGGPRGPQHKIYPRIDLQMTDRDVVERVRAHFGLKRIYHRTRDRKKPIYGISITSAQSIGWMMTLYPWLSARRRQKIREIIAVWKRQPVSYRYATKCVNGHAFDGANLIIIHTPTGGVHRRCRICTRTSHQAASRRYMARQRALKEHHG